MMRNGFTLIEVVVALAILATTLYGGFFLLNQTTVNSSHLRDTVLANWVATNASAVTVLGDVKGSEQQAEITEQRIMYGEEFLVTFYYEPIASSNEQQHPIPDDESANVALSDATMQKVTISVAKLSAPDSVLENVVVFR